MRIATFKRGIHPPDSKKLSENESIEIIWPRAGDELLYPMSQHIGAPAEPIVEKGDYVLIGQKIAKPSGFVSTSIHASVSGVVKDIRNTLTPTGIVSKAVVIEYDGENKEHPDINKTADYKELSKEEILSKIQEAGIVGLGGAGFPTHIKLNPPEDKNIDYIIVNAAECEPYLTTDYRVLIEESDVLIRGLEIMLRLHKNAKGIIAIETNKAKALSLFDQKCAHFANIEVVGLKTKYPQGAEKQLINACTGREVPSGGLPADIGCIVNNVDTVIAIERAIERGRPLMRKIITVSGSAVVNPGNYKVRIGMKYKDLMEIIGGYKSQPAKLISGGPMMGVTMFTTDVPIIKTSSAFLCFTEEEARLKPETNCIRCGRCVDKCPVSLMPLELNQYVLHREFDLFKKNNGMDCIECGTCSYVCPANRHLTQSLRVTRRDLLSKKVK